MKTKLRGLLVLYAVVFNGVPAQAFNGAYSNTYYDGDYAATAVTAANDTIGLSSLVPGAGKLSPVFETTGFNYTDMVPSNAASMTITPTAINVNAVITVNGVAVSSGNASAAIALSVGSNTISVVVSEPAGESETYTVTVTRLAPTDANLSALRLSAGVLSPGFDGGTTAYTVVAGPVSTITVMPTSEDRLATIKVNGNTVMSAAASPVIPISIGSNMVTVVVTAADGVTSKTYAITVYGGSKNSALSNLAIPTGNGNLIPFNYTTTNYTASVAANSNIIEVMPSAADGNATINLNGTVVQSGIGWQIPIHVGQNTITVVVTAQNGFNTTTYTVVVTQPPSPVATLSALAISTGTLSPAFARSISNYSVTVPTAVASIRLTPTLTDTTATIKINGAAVANGAASAPIPLPSDQNTITVVVTAQDGTTTDTYTVKVYKGSTNDALSNLKVSSGTLSPAFNYQTTTYSVTVATTVTSITVTPTAADAKATITVNGVAVASKAASGPINLVYGNNPITVSVTAQNGFSVNTYTINVDRPESAVATLSNMTISSGTLSPAFASGTNNYTVILPAAITALKVTPTLTDASATVKINGTAVANGTASAAIPLSNGKSAITIAITAQDGFDMDTYNITVYKGATNDALSNLKISHGALTPAFNYQTTAYRADVNNTISSIKITPTAADSNATITVNGKPVASNTASPPISLVVGVNPIPVTVTAQNGITYQTYDVVISRAAASANSVYQPVGVEKPTESLSIAEDGIKVHQGISPNGDGIEDFLQIDNINQYPDNKLAILNRSGQLVFEAKGYDNSAKLFDGHSSKNGQMQLPGTYFYQLDYAVNGVVKHKTGFIVLKY